jgi:hypothetical protein
MDGEDFSIILADMEYYDNVGANFFSVQDALKNATEGVTVYGTTFDVQMAYEKGAGTRGMEYLESLEDITNLAKNLIENDTTIDKKNTKVGKAMLELNDIRIAEERLSNTDAAKFKPTSKDESKIPKNEGMALADFMFPPNSGKEVTLNDKNDKLKKAMLTEGQIINDTEIKSIRNNYDSKRRIVYQSLQLLNFTDNYNKTGKGFPLKTWAIFNLSFLSFNVTSLPELGGNRKSSKAIPSFLGILDSSLLVGLNLAASVLDNLSSAILISFNSNIAFPTLVFFLSIVVSFSIKFFAKLVMSSKLSRYSIPLVPAPFS